MPVGTARLRNACSSIVPEMSPSMNSSTVNRSNQCRLKSGKSGKNTDRTS